MFKFKWDDSNKHSAKQVEKSEFPKASQICPTDFSDISVVSVGIFSGKWMSISMPKNFSRLFHGNIFLRWFGCGRRELGYSEWEWWEG